MHGKKIENWLGRQGAYDSAYAENDMLALTLLKVLKERNYWFVLGTETDELDMLTGEYRFKIVPPQGKQVNVYAKTIAEAISSAILQLIAQSNLTTEFTGWPLLASPSETTGYA